MPPGKASAACAGLVLLASGCIGGHRPIDRSVVAEQIEARTGTTIPKVSLKAKRVGPPDLAGSSMSTEQTLAVRTPPGVSLVDGLDEDEAVAFALWNNAAFEAGLADLGIARADLLDAGLLRNPILSLLFPVGPKQLEATLKWPIDALWQRPRRVAAARLASRAVAERLVHDGLSLIAETRIAYIDLAAAEGRAALCAEQVRLAARIMEIMDARLRAGDISALEARAARSEAARTRQEAARLALEVDLARARLETLMGLAISPVPFALGPQPESTSDDPSCGDLPALLAESLAARPDVRAAEITVESAAARAGWERSRIASLIGVIDANGSGSKGFEVGPGLEVEMPVFSHNQGGIARASAELERATRLYIATQHRVALEIRDAYLRVSRAREAVMEWRTDIVPALEIEIREAQKAHESGEVSYLYVLEATRRLDTARAQALEASIDLRRLAARLDQRIGRTCTPVRTAPVL